MRLLIYLLALISGFSAAEAARSEVNPASSVAQTAVAVAEALASQEQASSVIPVSDRPDPCTACVPNIARLALAAPTPVLRHDRSRE